MPGEQYGRNQLINPSFEDGLTGWHSVNSSVVPGGTHPEDILCEGETLGISGPGQRYSLKNIPVVPKSETLYYIYLGERYELSRDDYSIDYETGETDADSPLGHTILADYKQQVEPRCLRQEGPSGEAKQQVVFPRTPTDVLVRGDFLPDQDSSRVFGMIVLLLEYADGSYDEIVLPARDDTEGVAAKWI